jgi:hypothetical protein
MTVTRPKTNRGVVTRPNGVVSRYWNRTKKNEGGSNKTKKEKILQVLEQDQKAQ